MIARSLALSSSKARTYENHISNLTSSKQKDSLKNFQDYYVPPDHLFEITEKVDIERTINNQEEPINNESVVNPRRSLAKQIEIWNNSEPREKKIKLLSDDYYHESITVTTSNFLENMRTIVIQCEEKIRKKRKELVTETTLSIRKQWEAIRLNLLNAVTNWAKASEQAQVAAFLEKGDILASGPLAELAARLSTKREELQLYFSRVVQLYKNNEILKSEELTKHTLDAKSFLKEIWDQHYQFQVQELKINSENLIEQIHSVPYQFSEGPIIRDTLHRSVDSSLAQFSIFQPFFENFYRREEEKTLRAEMIRSEGALRKNIAPQKDKEDVIVQSFISSTMKQLEILKAQRDQEWKVLTGRLIK